MCEFSDKVDAAKAAVVGINPEQASTLLNTAGVVFVDPRPRDAIERTTGLIPGAFQVSLEDIEHGKLPSELSDRDVRIVAACQGGPMGAIAAHALQKQGYSRVNYLDGGTQAWLDAGFATNR